MAIQGLLFDFDGLLVDTETPSRLVWEELYREHGHELPQDQWATLVGTIGAPFDPCSWKSGAALGGSKTPDLKSASPASTTRTARRTGSIASRASDRFMPWFIPVAVT